MALARRLAVALLAILGLALTVLGAWFAIVLGPKGTATFTATANQPLIVGPNVLNRVSVPATVTAHAASGPVFLGAATAQDTTDAVGKNKHDFVVAAQFPARTLQVEQLGLGGLDDPSGFHVWRATGTDTLTLTQDQAPQAVLVYPTQGGPVDVSVSFSRSAWFLESLVALVVGLIVMAFAGGWLWQQQRAPAASPDALETSSETPPEDAAEADPQTRTEEAR